MGETPTFGQWLAARRPQNHHMLWTPLEGEQLRLERERGLSVEAIAQRHGRSVAAVRQRISRVVRDGRG